MNQPDASKATATITFGKITGAFALMLAVHAVYFWAVRRFYNLSGTEAGVFGDMFGALNPFFSGLALIGVIYSVILQSEELSLQRVELRENRKELERSAKAQEKTEEVLSRQLHLSVISARLSALPELIERQTQNVQMLVGGVAIRELNDDALLRYTREEGKRSDQVKKLFRLREEMESLYSELSELESARSRISQTK